MKLLSLVSEGDKLSLMRVMSLICCLNAVAISLVGITRAQVDYSGVSLLVSSFLTAAMGGKIMQKRIEVSGAKSDIVVEK